MWCRIQSVLLVSYSLHLTPYTLRPGLLQAATFNYNTGTAQPAFNSEGKVVWLADHIHSADTNTWISGGPHSRLIEPVLALIDKDKRQQVKDIGSTSNSGSSSSSSLLLSSSLEPAKAFQHKLLQQGCGMKFGAYYFDCLDYLGQPEQCTLLQKSTGNTLVFLARQLSKTPTPAGWADTAALPVLIRLLLDRGLELRGLVSPSQQQQQQQQQQQSGHHGQQPQQQQQIEDDLRAAISAATAAELQPQGLLWTEDVIDTEEGADEGL